MYTNLRQFIEDLRKDGELAVVKTPVDPKLELPEIHRRVIAEGGPALLFEHIIGSPYPVVTNLFGTSGRLERALGKRPEQTIQTLVEALPELLPPRLSTLWSLKDTLIPLVSRLGQTIVPSGRAPVLEIVDDAFDLTKLPATTSWPEDGGPFFTLPLVYTEHPIEKSGNLGMYRMQIFDDRTTGMHWQIHKGGGFHYHEAEKRGEALPATVFLGGPPVLIVSAIAPLPEAVPELLFASFLLGQKLPMTRPEGVPHALIAEAEFAFVGSVPPQERRPEGPFGDHYGYYSLVHDFPVFHLKRVYHRRDAIFPATVVGKPIQEDYWIGEYLQRLLSPFYPLIMPGVKSLWTYGETGFHALAGAVVRESYSREALAHGLRILGEGQLTLTKFLMLTDQMIDLSDVKALLTAILERFDPRYDLVILPDTSMDTLDYTGRRFNHGSKAIMLGTGPVRRTLPGEYTSGALSGIDRIAVFSPGVLVISGLSYEAAEDLPHTLLKRHRADLEPWPLIFLVDQAEETARTQASFLWTVFMRFDPAHDLFGEKSVHHNKLSWEGPLIIDARMKPFYPKEVEPDEATVRRVNEKWHTYFASLA
ncbi:MAG: UbiD family decarboxylase [Candidatus Carbobacillus altaicus]|uniref:3-polyprenyl-4-hydroxybenzoate carboxy-lyase n=1 Tax=Candidatus Carbonibacillus altaicus TaxID=2163959 RepID=A0A2R6Y4B5_9BACL|nr:UbiD family decarboxylase [Candidatus Carbobacillus altaicus]PTQ57514.1 MAG: 3-polyprenyl-4-hydroxybenzoate carboxy-lyase [Candidatus Carbobacillus altaicus]